MITLRVFIENCVFEYFLKHHHDFVDSLGNNMPDTFQYHCTLEISRELNRRHDIYKRNIVHLALNASNNLFQSYQFMSVKEWMSLYNTRGIFIIEYVMKNYGQYNVHYKSVSEI